MDKKVRIGIIGCGAIGTELALFVERGLKTRARLYAVCDCDTDKIKTLAQKLARKLSAKTLPELIRCCDLSIECAGVPAVKPSLAAALKYRKHIIILSVGGLLNAGAAIRQAKRRGIKVYVPSGAICGVDGAGALSLAGIKNITLTTSKPPQGLAGASYIDRRGIDLSRITKATLVFEGTVADAVKHFPKNINVAATLELAAGVPVKVRLVADPGIKRNIHRIKIEAEAGDISIEVANNPSKMNPKTSALAALSAQNLLKKILGNFIIGS